MKRFFILSAVAAALGFCAVALAAEPIRIGAVLSVTGPASFLGEPEKNSMLMLQDEINAKGGVLGRMIELVVYDDETDVNKAVLATEKLLKKDGVAVALGSSITGNTLAMSGKFVSAETPLVSLAAAEKIVRPVNPWVFKVAQSDRLAVGRILAHAKSRGYKNIALITVSDGFGQAGREVLKEMLPAEGFTLAADEVYGPKDTDMTAQLTKIKSAGADAIICWGTNPGPAVVAGNRIHLGMATPLYMSHGVASKKFIELAGAAANGLLLPASKLIVADQLPDNDPQKVLLTGYAKDYQAKFGAAPSQFGGYGYDSLLLAVRAIEAAGSDKPAGIRAALEKLTDVSGVTGVFSMSPGDHNGLSESAFVMVEIVDGDWKIIP
ncbi:MAG: ABC transporter substrate-binding protein [Desulfovibrionaceae bacterium]|nr:ABC transporter substrate-binding protein [Desulfovibrionaceae bacterium]MBF0513434.1 ABC transporter substrate-binding protein [Desulfovibrionaceae bacterium]